MPPARLTAAATSRQWVKAKIGNSIPNISQSRFCISDALSEACRQPTSAPCPRPPALLALVHRRLGGAPRLLQPLEGVSVTARPSSVGAGQLRRPRGVGRQLAGDCPQIGDRLLGDR